MINFFSQLSYSILFKFFFLFLLIILTVFLLYIEFKKTEEISINSNLEFKTNGGNVAKTVKDVFLRLIPALIAYESVLDRSRQRDQAATQAARDKTERILSSEDRKESAGLVSIACAKETELASFLGNHVELSEKMVKTDTEKTECYSYLQKCAALRTKKADNIPLTKDEQIFLGKEEFHKAKYNLAEAEHSKMVREIAKAFRAQQQSSLVPKKEIEEEVKKSSILNLNFDSWDYRSFISTLTQVELLAFSGLLLNQIIISYTFTLILIIYGDFLVERFQLKTKFPKLAKIIEIRQKLQGYYMKLAFTWIFLATLPQIYVYINILLPKILSIFN